MTNSYLWHVNADGCALQMQMVCDAIACGVGKIHLCEGYMCRQNDTLLDQQLLLLISQSRIM